MKAMKATALLAALLTVTVPVAGATDAWAKPKPKGAMTQILVVDDSTTVRQQLAVALNGAGFSVTEAVDGQDGLNRASTAPYGVILVDQFMPGMDGVTTVRNLRASGTKAPVIILSTESGAASTAAFRAAGANGFMAKPFDANQLVSLVRKLSSR